MGLVLGIIAALITLGVALIIFWADAMSDNPDVQISVWPTLVIGGLISAGLIFSHYHHWAW